MDRSGSIIYFGTENNMKSCLGLEAILKDGWNVQMVIAYKPPPQKSQPRSILYRTKHFFSSIVKLHPRIDHLVRRVLKKTKNYGEFSSLEELSRMTNTHFSLTKNKSLQGFKDEIVNISPDIILSNGWMFKIGEDIFSIARLIALNCHSSYLPEYRGGNVTYAPLINEEKESGVTVHQLVEKFDAGAILAQRRVPIQRGETPSSLNVKRALITGSVLIEALEIAGHEELYKPNPPTPFYFRCDYATYKRYKRINFLRKLVALPIKRYEPKERYDI